MISHRDDYLSNNHSIYQNISVNISSINSKGKSSIHLFNRFIETKFKLNKLKIYQSQTKNLRKGSRVDRLVQFCYIERQKFTS